MATDSDFPQAMVPPSNDPLDLSAAHVRAWHALLPSDIKEVVKDDADAAADPLAAAVARELNLGEGRTWVSIVHRHGDEIVLLGQARRVRMLAWLAQASWPQPGIVNGVARVTGSDDDGKGGEGRAKVAPLFRADIEAMAGVYVARAGRAAMSVETVSAVDAGTKDFERSYSGAM